MAYASASSQVSATPGVLLATAIEAVLTSHSTWEPVETMTSGTSTYRVWRNRGSGVAAPNSWGQDFYIVIITNTTVPTAVYLRSFEAFTASGGVYANHRVFRPVGPTTTSGVAVTLNADGSSHATAGVTLGISTVVEVSVATATSPNTWDHQIIASKNNLWVGVRHNATTSDYAFCVGLFETFQDPAETTEFPLFMTATASQSENFSSGCDTGTSRHPKKPTANADAQNFQHRLAVYNVTGGDLLTVDRYFGAAKPTRVLLASLGTPHNTYGILRGLLHDAVYLADGGVSTRQGDIATINETPYWKFKVGTSQLSAGIWVNRDAA